MFDDIHIEGRVRGLPICRIAPPPQKPIPDTPLDGLSMFSVHREGGTEFRLHRKPKNDFSIQKNEKSILRFPEFFPPTSMELKECPSGVG